MAEFRNKEEASAGMLNGVMLILLGAALPAFLAWEVTAHWQVSVDGLRNMTRTEAISGIVVSLASLSILGIGARLLRRSVIALQKR